MSDTWARFEAKMREVVDLGRVQSLLGWDQQVVMPPGGTPARASMSATTAGIQHAKLTDPELGALVDELQGVDLPADRAAMLERLAYARGRAVRVPERLATDLARAHSEGVAVWQDARAADDFERFRPALERILALKAEEAEALGYEREPYEAHLESYERGVSVDEVQSLFTTVAEALRPMIAELGPRPGESGLPPGPYDGDAQLAYSRDLAARLGLDPAASRVDLSAHPFTSGTATGDVRITTRVFPGDPLPSILATMHETGHALYEAGLPEPWDGTSIGEAASLGVHESQSRLWENHVGRSLAFWEGELARTTAALPQLTGVRTEQVFRAANQAGRSLIRVEADELTYPMHIILRFELELALSRGELAAADLPAAWDDAMQRHLGIRPSSAADGVLQDVHWSAGYFGYFPTYLLGSVWGAALFARAREAIGGPGPSDAAWRAGDFGPLLRWLREHVHAKGASVLGRDLISEVCGEVWDVAPYLEHLRGRRSDVAALG